jgi:dTDP-4-dehydrorhamnose 3,5-epimerase
MGAITNPHEINVTSLARIPTKGGDVLHGIKLTDHDYIGFGEAYFSWVDIGAVKAWKRHMKMTMNVIVPVGQVRFVFRLPGEGQFRVEDIGVERYSRITVPPGIWFGFKGLSSPQSLVLNIASIPHDPAEVERLSVDAFNYDWSK